MKCFNDFIKEGRGISDNIKEYSKFIYSLFEEGTYKNQMDLDYESFPLMDLRVEFVLSDKYYGNFDPTQSNVVNNKIYNIYIILEIDKTNINKSIILGLITHELTHVKEYFEIHKKIQKTGISIKPTYIDIRIVYKSVDVDPNSEYYKFIYLIYLSLDTEMNSRISQVYHYLYDFGINDKDILLDKLKLHKNWGYLEMLEKFDYDNFIDVNIKEMGESGLLKITNELIDKFKDKILNKRTKSLNFIDNPTRNLNDLYDFYKNWNIYFNKKSKKHRDKFLYLISEIIEDLNGNRPFNEDFRNKKFDPQLK